MMARLGGMAVSLRVLGYVAIAEALSFVCLMVAMVFKYGFDAPGGVTIFGQLHGVLFLAYVALAVVVRQQEGWGVRRTAVVLAAAVVPVAGFVVGERLLRDGDAAA